MRVRENAQVNESAKDLRPRRSQSEMCRLEVWLKQRQPAAISWARNLQWNSPFTGQILGASASPARSNAIFDKFLRVRSMVLEQIKGEVWQYTVYCVDATAPLLSDLGNGIVATVRKFQQKDCWVCWARTSRWFPGGGFQKISRNHEPPDAVVIHTLVIHAGSESIKKWRTRIKGILDIYKPLFGQWIVDCMRLRTPSWSWKGELLLLLLLHGLQSKPMSPLEVDKCIHTERHKLRQTYEKCCLQACEENESQIWL